MPNVNKMIFVGVVGPNLIAKTSFNKNMILAENSLNLITS